MVVLDTNVVSARMGRMPEPAVADWLNAQAPAELFITAITVAEIALGIALLRTGQRRSLLEAAVRQMRTEVFAGRVLDFDAEAAMLYATIRADRQALGRPVMPLNAQIAAIARSRGHRVATRNTQDFVDCGVELVAPFRGTACQVPGPRSDP